MKKLIQMALSSFLVVSVIVPSVHAETPKEKVIIVFKDDIDKKAVTNINGEIENTFINVPIVTGEVPEAAIPLLEKNKDVLAVELDQRVEVKGQIQDWGIAKVGVKEAWNSQFTGKGVKVAVLDTGISAHEDLIISGGVSLLPYTTSYQDDNGHGTHVGGIIGAKNNDIGTVGVAPEASLYAVKVLDQEGSGYLSDIIAGIDWAITNKMDIINMSLGVSSDSPSLHQAVDKAYNNGILVVAAAGNNGNTAGSGDTVLYPAKYESAIAVAATDADNKRGSFSATGNKIEVSAPGVSILSTYLNNSYVKMSGTSMATPYVAGTLAMLKQANPGSTPAQLRAKLDESTLDLGVAGKDTFFGYGLVQAQNIKSASQPVSEQPAYVQPTPVQPPVKTEPKKPVVKPVPNKKMTTTVSTLYSTYRTGNVIWINLKALDKTTKKPIPYGSIQLTITPPKGKAKVVNLKTNAKGVVSYRMVVSRSTAKGYYKLSTTTSLKGYDSAIATRTIRIK